MFHPDCWTTAGAAHAARHYSRHQYKFSNFSRNRLLRNDRMLLCAYVLIPVTGCVSPFACPAMQLNSFSDGNPSSRSNTLCHGGLQRGKETRSNLPAHRRPQETCRLEAKVVEDLSTQKEQHLLSLCNQRGELGFPTWCLPLAQPQSQCSVAGSCDGCSKHTCGSAKRAQMLDTIVRTAYSVLKGLPRVS